jgi:hypothetical protein
LRADAVGVGNVDGPDFGKAAGGEFPEWIGNIDVEARELGVVGVAADEDDAAGSFAADEVDQALVVAGVVDPGFPAGKVGEHLQARGEDAQLRGNVELLLQPLPLALAEHGCVVIGQACVGPWHFTTGLALRGFPFFIRGAAKIVMSNRRAVVSQVGKNDLHAPLFRTEQIRRVDAIA